ncbi:GIY-YIG nuclease family protein [Sediminibacterium roseum]|uniref:GIY-YIG nuclease family protein n=1 Tax=Sediminibacterium roseum TaxID=1978412 RepID=A0ABW9ZYM6_9BACT|nr:GIY-YIG nuclease family protein [Sediminibacterium roseum]
MAFYVYIIQSDDDKSFYKGFSEDPLKRLVQHNNGESFFTSFKGPWKLVYVERCLSKTEALKREKNLKKASLERIQALIAHPKNIVSDFTKS